MRSTEHSSPKQFRQLHMLSHDEEKTVCNYKYQDVFRQIVVIKARLKLKFHLCFHWHCVYMFKSAGCCMYLLRWWNNAIDRLKEPFI